MRTGLHQRIVSASHLDGGDTDDRAAALRRHVRDRGADCQEDRAEVDLLRGVPALDLAMGGEVIYAPPCEFPSGLSIENIQRRVILNDFTARG
jgi:hypothetical protein